MSDMMSPDSVLSSAQGLKKVKAQGFGANTDEEMDQYGKNDMRALSEMLGNKVITVMAALCAPSLVKFGRKVIPILCRLVHLLISRTKLDAEYRTPPLTIS